MLRAFTIRAGWFRPGHDDRRHPGTLSYHPSRGFRLTVHGASPDAFGLEDDKPVVDRLCGVATDGKCLSACDGFITRSEWGPGGFGPSQFLFHRLFVGRQFVSDISDQFVAVDVCFNQLLECLGVRVGEANTADTDITLRSFLPLSAKLLQDAEKQITSVFRRSVSSHYLGKVMRAETAPFLRTEFTTPVSWANVSEVLTRLQYFVALLRDCRALPIRAAVRLGPPNIEQGDREEWCDLFFCPVGAELGPTLPRSCSVNLSLTSLAGELNEPTTQMVERWFQSFARNRLLMSLYFTGRYRSRDLPENRFLNLMQGLETFHRQNFTNENQTSEEHSARLESVLNSCPPQYREWLNDRLRHSNEPTLRQRLREILSRYHANVVGVLRDEKSFIQAAVNTRNELAHGRKSEASRVKLMFLNSCLSAVIEAILMNEVGLSDSTTLRTIQARWTAEVQQWVAEPRCSAGNSGAEG